MKQDKFKIKIQDKIIILDIANFIVLEPNSNLSVLENKSFLQSKCQNFLFPYIFLLNKRHLLLTSETLISFKKKNRIHPLDFE